MNGPSHSIPRHISPDTINALIAANAPGRAGYITLDGKFESWHAEPTHAHAHGHGPRPCLGPDVHADRARFHALAVERGEPVAVRGMLLGQWALTVYIPLKDDADRPSRILFVVYPAAVASTFWAPAPRHETFLAGVHDLGPLAALTNTELEVLRLLGQGLRASEMARLLHRSVKTIDWRRFRLGQKLGLESRVVIARIAIDCGLASTADEEFQAILRGRSVSANWPPEPPLNGLAGLALANFVPPGGGARPASQASPANQGRRPKLLLKAV